jgi:hypothetical protein
VDVVSVLVWASAGADNAATISPVRANFTFMSVSYG